VYTIESHYCYSVCTYRNVPQNIYLLFFNVPMYNKKKSEYGTVPMYVYLIECTTIIYTLYVYEYNGFLNKLSPYT